MNQSQLDKDLKTLSERSPWEVPNGFNGRVWAKIRERKASDTRENWFKTLFWLLRGPEWLAVAFAVTLFAGWSFGRMSAGSISRLAETRLVTTITGEVIDLACYYDDGASGPEHAACARMCIESGLPVGLKTKNGQVYVLIGDQVPMNRQLPQTTAKHESLNKQLAQYAAKIVSIRGTLVSKEGVNVVENAQLID
jgi:hypothetical protein